MAAKQLPIEEWRLQLALPAAIFAGVKAYKGWADGKVTTEKDLKDAVQTYLQSSIDGREGK